MLDILTKVVSLGRAVAQGLLWLWPISAPIVAISLLTAALSRPRLGREHLQLIRPVILWAVVLFAAAAWEGPRVGSHYGWTFWVVAALCSLCVLSIIVAMIQLKNDRLFAVSVGLVELWITAWVYGIAAMAVTGDWL